MAGLSKALREMGVSSETVTTDLGSEGAQLVDSGQPVEFNGVKVRYFSRLLPERLPRDFALSPKLSRWLKAHVKDYDIVNIHGLFSYPNTVAARAAHHADVPYVLRPCGMLDPFCLTQSRLKKSAYLRLFDSTILRNAAAVSFTTEQEAEASYKVRGQGRSAIIPLGVGAAKELGDGATAPFAPTGKKVILFLSRLDPIKGLDLLLPALARLKTRRDDFLAVIAGGGRAAYESKVKADVASYGIENEVLLTGFIEGGKKRQLLEEATCFVLPSYHENFGVSVAEAMAAGCPVVISDRVNIHTEVSAAGAGRVVACDAVEICNALDDVLSDEAVRLVMATNAQRLVREKYDWSVVGEKVLALYHACIDEQATRIKL